jgi:hypothetical protein
VNIVHIAFAYTATWDAALCVSWQYFFYCTYALQALPHASSCLRTEIVRQIAVKFVGRQKEIQGIE